MSADSSSTDLLVIGSGPAGCAYARFVAELRPNTRIAIVEGGPSASDPPGSHVSQLPLESHPTIQMATQGPERGQDHSQQEYLPFKGEESGVAPTPGLYLVAGGGMPAAALASGVGGSGAYWGGLTPRPYGSERSELLSEGDWEHAFKQAERVLLTSENAFRSSESRSSIEAILARRFSDVLPANRTVGPHPIAARLNAQGALEITGSSDIIRPIDSVLDRYGRFDLHADTLCRELIVDGDRACGAVLEERTTGAVKQLLARVVVVAADAFHTPQLLWMSNIRPRALGHYLMDHPVCCAAVALDGDVARKPGGEDGSVTCVPFSDETHPFHGILLHRAPNLVPIEDNTDLFDRAAVTAIWLGRSHPHFDNCVTFSTERKDWCGMAGMTIAYGLAPAEEEERMLALEMVDRAAAGLGTYLPGWEPSNRPLGASLHITGTVRMGAQNDEASVCNSASRVWGFRNLYVAGNGVIPCATAVNPTLTSVALAAHSAREAVGKLD